MKKTILTFFTLAGLILISTLPVSAGPQPGDPAPEFSLLTLDGKTFDLAEYKGKKPVYLIFWATWCPNCKHEIPHIKALYNALNDKVAIVAINVSINDSLAKVRRYVDEYKLPYPVAFDDGAKVTDLYGIIGTPTQIVIDIQGIIRYRNPATPEDLSEHLDALTNSQ